MVEDAFRISFWAIWAIDAVLKWLPGFRSTYVADITTPATGQPGWLFDFSDRLQTPRPDFLAYLVAVLGILGALALILGFARKLTYAEGAVLSLLIWGAAEGFGGPYMKGTTDIGTSIIYALVLIGLLKHNYYVGPSRRSVDWHLEQHISWWWRVAEMRDPGHALGFQNLDIISG